MNNLYLKVKKVWDEIFEDAEAIIPEDKQLGNEDLDDALDWLCDHTESILDFGCGNGVMLFSCGHRGTKKHIGIDISTAAIDNANECKKLMKSGEYQFIEGYHNSLQGVESESMDSVILSNIIDNMIPEEVMNVLDEVSRVLKENGKVLVKLNPYLTEEQIKEWGIKVIDGNLLDDGLLLWNQTTEEWDELFLKYFNIEKYSEIYYEEIETYNRLYLMTKKN